MNVPNELKKSGVSKIIIGDPWSPDSGNWIHVKVEFVLRSQRGLGSESTTTCDYRFKVQHFNDILPRVLEFSARIRAIHANGDAERT